MARKGFCEVVPCDQRAVAQLAGLPPGSAAIPTHIQVEGIVTYAKGEKDGDRHIRISEGDAFLVLECIPEIPALREVCRAAKKGRHVRAWGISRYDGAPGHSWHEVHPVLGMEILR